MKSRILLLCLITMTLFSGCTLGGQNQNIKLQTSVEPGKVNLGDPTDIDVKVQAINIGKSIETITAYVMETEGLSVEYPDRTNLTLKPGESRVITFKASLTEDAVPGNYRIDVRVETDSGDTVTNRAQLKVVRENGFF